MPTVISVSIWLPASSVLSACCCLDRYCVHKSSATPRYNRTSNSASPPSESDRLLITLERAPRGEKLPKKTAQRPRCCSKPKQQLCIQNGTRAYYLNYLQRGRVSGGKEGRQSDWLANQMGRKVIDRQIEDRQTSRNKADGRWYPS